MGNQSKRRAKQLRELRALAGGAKRAACESVKDPRSEKYWSERLSATYGPSGGLVPWFFGVGVGAALNCISSDPRILYGSWLLFGGWLCWVLWPKRLLGRIATVAMSLLLLYPCHWFVVFKQEQMNQGNVESSVSMGPYSGTDTTNPLDTDFAIRNTGGFTITNLTAVGVIVRAGSPRSNITNFEMPRNTFKKLEPGEEAVIASGFYNFIRGTVDFGEIEFLVSFEDVRHPEYRISRKFRFWLKNSPQGPRWLAINPNQKLS